jgi:hypothetical protein
MRFNRIFTAITKSDQLDQKLWVALSCPTRGLEFDPQTLDLIDTDKDGHIRVPEIIAAVKWAGSLLNNPDDLLKESDELPLQAINADSPEGAQILASARQILANLGKPDAQSISLNDTATPPASSPRPNSTATASCLLTPQTTPP